MNKNFIKIFIFMFILININIKYILAQNKTTKAIPPSNAHLPQLHLDTVKTMTFKVHHSTWNQVPNGDPLQSQLDFVADYSVKAERPNKLQILDLTSTYESRYIKDKRGGISVISSDSYVSDGKKYLEWDKLTKVYSTASAAKSMAALSGLQQPQPLYPELLFTPDVLNSLKFRADGNEVINGKHTAVYRRYPPKDMETVVYLDTQTLLPVRISSFGFDRHGDRAEQDRSDFSDWQFDVKFPPNTFDTTPPSGYVDLAEKMKQRNIPATGK